MYGGGKEGGRQGERETRKTGRKGGREGKQEGWRERKVLSWASASPGALLREGKAEVDAAGD